jgi:hypothetical protein
VAISTASRLRHGPWQRITLSLEQALETTDDFGFGAALGRPALVVSLGGLVVLEADDHGSVEGSVGLAVAAAVQPVPGGHA